MTAEIRDPFALLPKLDVHNATYDVPLSPGTCENCHHRIAYNLAAGITRHTDPHPADCTCVAPFPDLQAQ